MTSSGSVLYCSWLTAFYSLQDTYTTPLTSIQCWHVHCEECWLRTLVKSQIYADPYEHAKETKHLTIYSLFFWREQRSCVLSATLSHRPETLGGSFCDTTSLQGLILFQPIRDGLVGSWPVIDSSFSSHLSVYSSSLLKNSNLCPSFCTASVFLLQRQTD